MHIQGLYMCTHGAVYVHTWDCICAHVGGLYMYTRGDCNVHTWGCAHMWGLNMCPCVCRCTSLYLGHRMVYNLLFCHSLTYSFESESLLRPGMPIFHPRWQLSGPSHSLVSFLHDTGLTDTLKTVLSKHISRWRGSSLGPHGCTHVFNH